MISFTDVLLDRQINSADTFTALLLTTVASTLLTMPRVMPLLARMGSAPRSAANDTAGAVAPVTHSGPAVPSMAP